MSLVIFVVALKPLERQVGTFHYDVLGGVRLVAVVVGGREGVWVKERGGRPS